MWKANRSKQSPRWMKNFADAKLALVNATKIANVITNDYAGQEAQAVIAGVRLE